MVLSSQGEESQGSSEYLGCECPQNLLKRDRFNEQLPTCHSNTHLRLLIASKLGKDCRDTLAFGVTDCTQTVAGI